MKKAILLLLAIALFPLLGHAQYEAEGNFPEADTLSGSNHGIAVDGENKIWYHDFYSTGPNYAQDEDVVVTNIYVYNEDGEEADFSPIQDVTVGDSTFVFEGSNGRGIRATDNGNIVYSHGATLILIDHETGEGIEFLNPEVNATALTAAGTDDLGNVYVTGVVGGDIVRFNEDLTGEEVVITGVTSVGRTMAVSNDGNTIYVPRHDAAAMLVYSRANDLAPWPEAPDTVLHDSYIEGITVHPENEQVWLNAAGYAVSAAVDTMEYTRGAWYGYNPETWAKEDSVMWEYPGNDPFEPDPEVNPADIFHRGIAFNNDGSTLYIGGFRNGAETFHPIQKFTGGPATSITGPVETPEGYNLDQNYPNPFNPSTTIEFALGQGGETTLKVYDISGREVATILSSQQLNAGSHTFNFDASNLSSGVYFYRLNSNGVQLTRKMTLVK